MHKTNLRRTGVVLVGLSLTAAACGSKGSDSNKSEDTKATGTASEMSKTESAMSESSMSESSMSESSMSESAMSESSATAAPTGNGELAGMKGTTPKGADVTKWVPAVNEFWVAKGNTELQDFNYAAESYDAVVTIALATEIAKDDGSAAAAKIVDVTKGGEKCTSFQACMDIIKKGGDPDYDGVSGPLEFNGNGEPLSGSYAILEFDSSNRIPEGNEQLVTADAPESTIVDLTPVTVERKGDGVLKIGSLLPETGSLAFLGPPEFAGVEYAIDEINKAGGVLGKPVEYSQGDSGDTSTGIATQTSTRLIGENVDAIIGAASSAVTLSVIDQITQAGVTMFSPANTSPALSTYDDKGLYFRDAPPDGLQGAVVANLVSEDGNASVYILNLDDAYGNGIAAVVADQLKAAGVEVLGQKAYDPTAASFDAEVDEIVKADPDAVVLISFDEGSKILRTAVEKGVGPTDKKYYGTDGNMGNALGENFDAGK